MQFHTINFLFLFLPAFMVIYHLIPTSWKNMLIITGSLLFYFLGCGGNYWWLQVILAMTVLVFYTGQRITGRSWLLGVSLGTMAALLTFFKLFDGGRHLPGGMSFYLFQMAAYLIDVFRGSVEPERSLTAYSAATLMFPKLLSGPIVRPVQMIQWQIGPRRVRAERYRGLEQLILGLSMKVLLADPLGGLWAKVTVVGFESVSTLLLWMALVSYALRLYLDFWGYSLMAMGLGRMLGYRLPENFRDPYGARSVSDFYRRWHITLGAWFREYVYFPLGGSRKGKGRTVINLTIVWLLTGLWHGTGANYLVWAATLVFFIIQEKLWLDPFLEKHRILAHIYVVTVILLSWVPFAAGGWVQMGTCFGRLFALTGQALNRGDVLAWGGEYLPYLIPGILLTTPFPGKLWSGIRSSRFADCILLVLFWFSVYVIASGAQSSFLYFQY